MSTLRLMALLLSCTLGFAAPLIAQKKQKVPRNHPSQCKYCHNDPELMQKGGVVSHGGFGIARKTIEEATALVPGAEIYWIETEHFKIGMAMGGFKVRQEEKAKLRAECAKLKEVFEDVPDKPKVIDPWLRAHLYAARAEKVYADMLEFIQVEQSVFPAPNTQWDMVGEYWGQGPHMGQAGKIELLFFPSEGFHVGWLRGNFGLRSKKSQRWHVIETGSLHLCAHTEQGSLKIDSAMHGHLVFNLSIMLTNSFKHYSYDMPVWLLEGIGHYMERRLNPKYNTFDSGEGGLAETTRKEKWEPQVKKLVAKDDAPGLATLVRMTNFAELDLDRHFACWSIIDYLERAHPGFVSKLIHRTANLRNEQNLPDGTNLLEEMRATFKDELKMSYLQFDRKWGEWVSENYASK